MAMCDAATACRTGIMVKGRNTTIRGGHQANQEWSGGDQLNGHGMNGLAAVCV